MIEPPPLTDYSYRSIKKYLRLPFFNQIFNDPTNNFVYRIDTYSDSVVIKKCEKNNAFYFDYWEFSRETNNKETFLNFQKCYRNDYFQELVDDKYSIL